MLGARHELSRLALHDFATRIIQAAVELRSNGIRQSLRDTGDAGLRSRRARGLVPAPLSLHAFVPVTRSVLSAASLVHTAARMAQV